MNLYTLHNRLFLTILASVSTLVSSSQSINELPQAVAFSFVKGKESRSKTINIPAIKFYIEKKNLRIVGKDSGDFKIISINGKGDHKSISVAFMPVGDGGKLRTARLVVSTNLGKAINTIDLNGIATEALEGENEPPLSTIVAALGYQIDVGWDGLPNHTKPELLGEEIIASCFRKASSAKVEIDPVARYSPDFELPFGYYVNTSNGPVKHQVGVLSKAEQYPEHQCLFPALSTGSTSFEPGTAEFGFYATGPNHIEYSEDVWNMLYFPENAIRAMRIYPVKNKQGAKIINTYLLCCEEAKNGDYNDYVFIVKNVIPVKDDHFVKIFDGKSLKGWHSYLKEFGINKDPNQNFKIEDSAIHVNGKNLGYLISEKGYFNFHAKLEFKWGHAKWPPRENAKRDGGFLYNIPMAEPDSIWPKSIECQIQEGDVGDFWMLGFSTLTVDGKTNVPSNHIQFVKKKDNERPLGEWNTVEVISYNGRCVQVVNGVIVNYGDSASSKGGRVILQSEFSEIYYRNVMIRQL